MKNVVLCIWDLNGENGNVNQNQSHDEALRVSVPPCSIKIKAIAIAAIAVGARFLTGT